MTTSMQKPLKDRIVHLLALKPYRKPELLLWLEREKASPKDKAELGAILEEVLRNTVCRQNVQKLKQLRPQSVKKDGFSHCSVIMLGFFGSKRGFLGKKAAPINSVDALLRQRYSL